MKPTLTFSAANEGTAIIAAQSITNTIEKSAASIARFDTLIVIEIPPNGFEWLFSVRQADCQFWTALLWAPKRDSVPGDDAKRKTAPRVTPRGPEFESTI